MCEGRFASREPRPRRASPASRPVPEERCGTCEPAGCGAHLGAGPRPGGLLRQPDVRLPPAPGLGHPHDAHLGRRFRHHFPGCDPARAHARRDACGDSENEQRFARFPSGQRARGCPMVSGRGATLQIKALDILSALSSGRGVAQRPPAAARSGPCPRANPPSRARGQIPPQQNMHHDIALAKAPGPRARHGQPGIPSRAPGGAGMLQGSTPDTDFLGRSKARTLARAGPSSEAPAENRGILRRPVRANAAA